VATTEHHHPPLRDRQLLQLHQRLTRAEVTRFLILLIVLWETLLKTMLDVIREILPHLAGIASLVQLVIGCRLHAHQKIAAVRMLQGGSVEIIPLWQMVWCLVKFVTIGQETVATGTTTLK